MVKKSFKKLTMSTIAIITVALAVFGIAAVRTASADLKPAVSIWIDPQTFNITTATHHLNDTFNVTLWANTFQDASNFSTFTWQIGINFDASLLTVTRVGYTNGSTSDFFRGHSTIPVTAIITSTSASIGESLIGSDSRSPGNGSLCWVEMRINQEPTGNATLTCMLDINNTDTFVLDGDLNEVTSTKYSVQYNYGPAPPDTTPPTIGAPSRTPSGNVPENGTVTIVANITDIGGSGVANATLSYTIDNSTWTNTTMTSSGNTFTGTIPGKLNGTRVWYKIKAFDVAGNNDTKYESGTTPYHYDVIPEFMTAVLIVMLTGLAGAMVVYRKKLVRLP
jgi:hypothetical protein